MIEPRLAASVQATALIRLAESGGDQATILRKGDPVAGAILLIVLIRGEEQDAYERYPDLDGGYSWQPLGLAGDDIRQKLSDLQRQRISRDPDLWIVELNLDSSERLDAIFELFAA